MVDRRRLLRAGVVAAAGGLAHGLFPRVPFVPGAAFGAERSGRGLPPKPRLSDDQVVFVEGGTARAGAYSVSFNARTAIEPKLRALCKTPAAVAAMVEWARENDLPFALRSGGHCFEDFSQSSELVIDSRLLNRVEFDRSERSVVVGAGALLSDIYQALAGEGYAVPVGACQSVGIAGLTLGGGFGYLSRAAGLTCDALQTLELIDAEGRRLTVDGGSYADLYWACRGGGGGSFGVATEFRFKAIPVTRVTVCAVEWVLSPRAAAGLLSAWQGWAPKAADEIGTELIIINYRDGNVLVKLKGQSLGMAAELEQGIGMLTGEAKPRSTPRIQSLTSLEAANFFSVPRRPTVVYVKVKADVVTEPLPPDAFDVLVQELSAGPVGGVAIQLDALGGAIARVPESATAFPHRKALFKIQYAAVYRDRGEEASRLQTLSGLYGSLRPYRTGASYVNYCDADLKDWPLAYWQSNLERLKLVKRSYDPANVFKHGQSVPLA